jgi:integrase
VRPTIPNSLIFPVHPSSSHSQIFHLDHAWRLIKKDADLEDFRFHDLRHTAASYLAMSGAGLREIGDILGHKSISMTMRYSHLTDDFKYKAISRMVNTIFGD